MSQFNKHCMAVVKEYLQTALIIDDQVSIGSDCEIIADKPLIKPKTMGEIFIEESNTENSLVASVDVIPLAPENATETINTTAVKPVLELKKPKGSGVISSLITKGRSPDGFDAAKATTAFYENGIVAGLYRPIIKDGLNEKRFANSVAKIASRSDVIVVDWILKKANSLYSQELIKKVLTEDYKNGGRLRAIVVYTGESKISEKRDELKVFLEKDKNIKLDIDGDFSLINKNIIISFYNKIGTPSIDRKISEDKLPDIVLLEFTKLVQGIVPAFAIKASSKVRDNTSRIIAKFDNELDAGFLAHRSLLPNPEDSEIFMLERYVSYLRNILSISKVDADTLGVEVLEKWVDQNYSKKVEIKIDDAEDKLSFTEIDLKEVLRDGCEGVARSIKNKTKGSAAKEILAKEENILKIMEIFSLVPNDVHQSSIELSILNSFRRTFKDIVNSSELPYLTQGTIIYSLGEEKYLVCVTPKCDTARIKGKRIFSFAEMEIDTSGKFDLVIPSFEGADYHKLVMNKKFYELKQIPFPAGVSKRVISVKDKDRICFIDESGTKYRWVGDLEDMGIQKRVSEIVGNFNRVGIDEVEWQRRHQ